MKKPPADKPEEATQTNPPKKGWIAKFREHMPKVIMDNAPRIVGVLKFVGSASIAWGKRGYFATSGYGFMAANLMLAIFGGKKSEALTRL